MVDRIIARNDPHELRAELLSTMCFPEDSAYQRHCYTHYITKMNLQDIKDSQSISTTVGAIREILESPSTEEMRRLEDQATKWGMIAGDLLATIYLMDRFQLGSEPSINKAVHVLQEFAEKRTYGDGEAMRTSERTIKNAWAAMKSVSHFWAAFRINQAYPYCESTELFNNDQNLSLFAGVAETMRSFGRTFVPKRVTGSILGDSNLWTLGGAFADAPPLEISEQLRPDLLEHYLMSYMVPPPNDPR